MRPEAQPIEEIGVDALIGEVQRKKDAGNRLVAISAAAVGEVHEITYSFETPDHAFSNLRLVVEPGTRIPSITPVFWGAFVYENEIHDLYGHEVTGLNVDYGGHFYATKVQYPFRAAATPKVTPASKEAQEKECLDR